MFLIAKIVRGRRLLHELEQRSRSEARYESEEEAKEEAAIEAATSIAAIPKRLAQNRHRKSSPGVYPNGEEEEQSPSHSGHHSDRSSQSIRRNLMAGRTIKSQSLRISKRAGSVRVSTRRRAPQESEERKTVRQKTDGSLDNCLEPIPDRARMRRTSSMPSVCEASTTVQAQGQAVRHYNYDSKLNKLQKKALKFTWHRLQTRNGGKRVENVFEEVFDRLVRQMPNIRDMFTTRMFLCAMNRHEVSSLRDHAKVMVKMVDMVIKNLECERTKRTDTGSTMDPRLIGRNHGHLRPYGMTGNYWEKLGETMVDVVLAQEAVRDLPGAGQAWVVLSACLVDQLRAGFDESRQYHTAAMMNKSSAVLHHATQHLHSQDTPEPTENELNRHFDHMNVNREDIPQECPVSSGRRASRVRPEEVLPAVGIQG